MSSIIEQAAAQAAAELATLEAEAVAAKNAYSFTLIGKDSAKGDVLRGWREYLGLTQTQLGEQCGYSVGSICRFENEVEPVPKSIQFAMRFAAEADFERLSRIQGNRREMKRAMARDKATTK